MSSAETGSSSNHIEEYKQGNYKFGKYLRQEDIIQEASNQKTFVFKGKLTLSLLFFPLFAGGISILCYTLAFLLRASAGTRYVLTTIGFVATGVFIVLAIIFIYLPLKKFVAVGPAGIEFYSAISGYQKFAWSEVSDVRLGQFSTTIKYYFRDYTIAKEILPDVISGQEFPGKNSAFLKQNTLLMYWELYKDKRLGTNPQGLMEKFNAPRESRFHRRVTPSLGPTPSPGPPCPVCNGATTFIPQYNRYFCYSCQKYV
jgi:hypothetical protein